MIVSTVLSIGCSRAGMRNGLDNRVGRNLGHFDGDGAIPPSSGSFAQREP
jgi:hypothetical protein